MTVETSRNSATEANGRRPRQDAASCALCGFVPSADDEPLRQLGEEPVVVMVCADRAACVSRYEASASR